MDETRKTKLMKESPEASIIYDDSTKEENAKVTDQASNSEAPSNYHGRKPKFEKLGK
ncbi:hypothetical protein TorRG33x02_166200, partial [Trema orientale]